MPAPAPIRLAWWNTGFSPPRGKRLRPTEAMLATGARVIGELLTNDAVGLLALGEVAASDVEECLSRIGSAASRLHWRVPPHSKRASSLAVLYDPARLDLLRHDLLEDAFGGVTFRTGWHLTFQPAGGGATLNVIVVHWPSHMFEEQGRKRLWIAGALHKRFERDRDVLMLGDFNDEPFSDSMRDGLIAYRDRSLVRLRRAYYNPFWRLLGEQQHVDEETKILPVGTHFHEAGTFSRWLTYDQIVVSSALLGKTEWRLIESATRVVVHQALITPRGTMKDFDHLPVTTAVTYNPEANDG